MHHLDSFSSKACITGDASGKQIDDVYIDNQSSTIHFIARLLLSIMANKNSAYFVRRKMKYAVVRQIK